MSHAHYRATLPWDSDLRLGADVVPATDAPIH